MKRKSKRQITENKENLRMLRILLEDRGPSYIAKKLGYKSAATPLQWSYRDSVPEWVGEKLKQVFANNKFWKGVA